VKFEGGCYCKQVRYTAEGEPMIKAECFCRECQYITGGGGLVVMAMPTEGVAVTQGAVKDFKREDIDGAVTRQFCPNCGTHLFTRAPGFEAAVIIKVGSMDDPSLFGKADSINFACDAQPFHRLTMDIPVFQRWMR
jgi:hypothetical protein